jgi:hypothetical protein
MASDGGLFLSVENQYYRDRCDQRDHQQGTATGLGGQFGHFPAQHRARARSAGRAGVDCDRVVMTVIGVLQR